MPRLMTIVTDEMLSIKEGNVKMSGSVDEVSGDDLQKPWEPLLVMND